MREHGYLDLSWGWFVLNKPPHARWDEAPASGAPVPVP
jgi:hypothetical protein